MSIKQLLQEPRSKRKEETVSVTVPGTNDEISARLVVA